MTRSEHSDLETCDLRGRAKPLSAGIGSNGPIELLLERFALAVWAMILMNRAAESIESPCGSFEPSY